MKRKQHKKKGKQTRQTMCPGVSEKSLGVDAAMMKLKQCTKTNAIAACLLVPLLHFPVKSIDNELAFSMHPYNHNGGNKTAPHGVTNTTEGNCCNAHNTKLKKWSNDSVFMVFCHNKVGSIPRLLHRMKQLCDKREWMWLVSPCKKLIVTDCQT